MAIAQQPARRRVERIRPIFPLLGRIANVDIVLLDVSLFGCSVEHAIPLRVGSHNRISFVWRDEGFDMQCVVVRSAFGGISPGTDAINVYRSGIRFTHAIDDSLNRLREFITNEIEVVLTEQRANARGDLPKYLDNLARFNQQGQMVADARELAEKFGTTMLPMLRIARTHGYVRFVFRNGRWEEIRTTDPEQPDDGFTVWAYEDPAQLNQLRSAYELGDRPIRWLIRRCAELSLVVDDRFLPQRFQP